MSMDLLYKRAGKSPSKEKYRKIIDEVHGIIGGIETFKDIENRVAEESNEFLILSKGFADSFKENKKAARKLARNMEVYRLPINYCGEKRPFTLSFERSTINSERSAYLEKCRGGKYWELKNRGIERDYCEKVDHIIDFFKEDSHLLKHPITTASMAGTFFDEFVSQGAEGCASYKTDLMKSAITHDIGRILNPIDFFINNKDGMHTANHIASGIEILDGGLGKYYIEKGIFSKLTYAMARDGIKEHSSNYEDIKLGSTFLIKLGDRFPDKMGSRGVAASIENPILLWPISHWPDKIIEFLESREGRMNELLRIAPRLICSFDTTGKYEKLIKKRLEPLKI